MNGNTPRKNLTYRDAVIHSQRQVIAALRDQNRELQMVNRVQRAAIEKLRRPWWRKLSDSARFLRSTNKPNREPK